MRYTTHIANLDLAWQVYQSGSLRAAANAVGLSHTTLGRRIRKLEADLSLSLFIRHGRQMRPTNTAAQLLPKYFERIQAIHDVLHEDHLARENGAIHIDAALLRLFPEASSVLTHLRKAQPTLHYVLTDSARAHLELRCIEQPDSGHQEGIDLAWAVVAHAHLRYDLQYETLFVPADAPMTPRMALIQYRHIERLPDVQAVIAAVKSQLGLGWMPINTGLMEQCFTEASGETERVRQRVILALGGDKAHSQAHQKCQITLARRLRTISDQRLAEC